MGSWIYYYDVYFVCYIYRDSDLILLNVMNSLNKQEIVNSDPYKDSD